MMRSVTPFHRTHERAMHRGRTLRRIAETRAMMALGAGHPPVVKISALYAHKGAPGEPIAYFSHSES